MTGLPCFPRTPVCHFSQSAMSIISILYHVFWLLMLNCFSIFICSVQNFSEDKHSRFVAIPCWRTKYFWCSKKRFYFLDFSCTFFAALISTLHTACGASWRFISLWRLCLPLTERQRSEVNYDHRRTSKCMMLLVLSPLPCIAMIAIYWVFYWVSCPLSKLLWWWFVENRGYSQ